MEDLITLSCPSCGGELEVNENTSVLKCRYCGAENLVRREHGAVSLESYARCPKCGRNDKVEKVTSILRSQSEESGLAKSLAPPERPAITPKPQPLPRPKKALKPTAKPRPSLKPAPETTPNPVINYRKKNYWYLIGGFGLFIFSYLAFFVFLGMSFDPSLSLSLICSGISIIPLVMSLVFIYIGYTGKKGSFDNVNSIKKNLDRRQINPEKLKSRFIVLSTIFFVLAAIFTIFSLLLMYDDIEILIPLLGISFLPAIFGFYFLFKLRSLRQQDEIERPSIDEFKLTLEKWEEENERLQNDWARENSRLINEWEVENNEIIKQWEAENARLFDNWEKENNRLLQEWKKRNDRISQCYRDEMERWENLYFCYRDDVVFIPGEGTYTPVEKMNDYLQREDQ